jgi:uncharacterized protein YjbI with pentapeptide repeats
MKYINGRARVILRGQHPRLATYHYQGASPYTGARITAEQVLCAYAHGIQDFMGMDLRGIDLHGEELRAADFSDADLRDADLSEAKLIRADLRGADLRDAYLVNSLVCRAIFRGADLSWVRFDCADLYRAKGVVS